jgi:hypothetical protein
MVYIFTEFNVGWFFLALLAAAVLFFTMVVIYNFRVGKRKASHPEDHEDFADKLDKRMNRQWAMISAVFGLVALGMIVNNIPNRTEQIARENEMVKLTKKVGEITERKMGERCSFNGQAVDADWIEADTFPCVTIGNHRIWPKSTTKVSKRDITIRRAFIVGTINENQSISRRAEIDLDDVRSGIQTDYPKTVTEMTSSEIADLIDQL